MHLYLNLCHNQNIRFLQLEYRIPQTATTSNRTKVGKHIVDWQGYADDLALTFENEANLKRGITLLNTVFNMFHLELNTKKTKTMILNHRYLSTEYPRVY